LAIAAVSVAVDLAGDMATEVLEAHSITGSARISTDRGIVRPRAFAVLRLITNSNLGGLLDFVASRDASDKLVMGG